MSSFDLLGNQSIVSGIASLGLAGIILTLFLTGRLPTPKERDILLKQIADKDKLLNEKDIYIQTLVLRSQETSDGLRKEVTPPLANLAQQLPVITAILQAYVSRPPGWISKNDPQ